jgi:hypothetical protein
MTISPNFRVHYWNSIKQVVLHGSRVEGYLGTLAAARVAGRRGFYGRDGYEGEVEMPRLVKGAKWTYGWVVVGPAGEMTIPPEAWREFGFQAGDEAVFLPGSRRSGGFSISTP